MRRTLEVLSYKVAIEDVHPLVWVVDADKVAVVEAWFVKAASKECLVRPGQIEAVLEPDAGWAPTDRDHFALIRERPGEGRNLGQLPDRHGVLADLEMTSQSLRCPRGGVRENRDYDTIDIQRKDAVDALGEVSGPVGRRAVEIGVQVPARIDVAAPVGHSNEDAAGASVGQYRRGINAVGTAQRPSKPERVQCDQARAGRRYTAYLRRRYQAVNDPHCNPS